MPRKDRSILKYATTSKQRSAVVDRARRLYIENKATHECTEWMSNGRCEVCDRLTYRVGDLVRVGKSCNQNPAGARAIVVEIYDRDWERDAPEGSYRRRGVFLLFPDGFADGFSAEDLELFDVRPNDPPTVPALQDYKFRSISHLTRDYRRGLFANAFDRGEE